MVSGECAAGSYTCSVYMSVTRQLRELPMSAAVPPLLVILLRSRWRRWLESGSEGGAAGWPDVPWLPGSRFSCLYTIRERSDDGLPGCQVACKLQAKAWAARCFPERALQLTQWP